MGTPYEAKLLVCPSGVAHGIQKNEELKQEADYIYRLQQLNGAPQFSIAK